MAGWVSMASEARMTSRTTTTMSMNIRQGHRPTQCLVIGGGAMNVCWPTFIHWLWPQWLRRTDFDLKRLYLTIRVLYHVPEWYWHHSGNRPDIFILCVLLVVVVVVVRNWWSRVTRSSRGGGGGCCGVGSGQITGQTLVETWSSKDLPFISIPGRCLQSACE